MYKSLVCLVVGVLAIATVDVRLTTHFISIYSSHHTIGQTYQRSPIGNSKLAIKKISLTLSNHLTINRLE